MLCSEEDGGCKKEKTRGLLGVRAQEPARKLKLRDFSFRIGYQTQTLLSEILAWEARSWASEFGYLQEGLTGFTSLQPLGDALRDSTKQEGKKGLCTQYKASHPEPASSIGTYFPNHHQGAVKNHFAVTLPKTLSRWDGVDIWVERKQGCSGCSFRMPTRNKRVSAETLKGMSEETSRGMGRFVEQARNTGAYTQV